MQTQLLKASKIYFIKTTLSFYVASCDLAKVNILQKNKNRTHNFAYNSQIFIVKLCNSTEFMIYMQFYTHNNSFMSFLGNKLKTFHSVEVRV